MRRLYTVGTHLARVTRLGNPDADNCPDKEMASHFRRTNNQKQKKNNYRCPAIVHRAGPGHCIRTPRCISSVYYATRRPRYTLDTPIMTRPGRPCSASAKHRPNPTFILCPSRRIQRLRVLHSRPAPNHPDKPFGVYDARDRPSFDSRSHTVCPVRARPRNQQPTQPPRESVERSWLWHSANERPASPLTLPFCARGEGLQSSLSHRVVTAG